MPKYLLYYSYNDIMKEEKGLLINTELGCVYTDKEIAIRDMEEEINDIITNTDNWFALKIESDIQYIRAYRISKDDITNEDESYMIVLEELTEV